MARNWTTNDWQIMIASSSKVNPVAARDSKPFYHLAYLDGLRACAALYVVAHHAMVEVWPRPSGLHGLTLILAGPFRFGHYAVGLFIVLSGFCLMIPVMTGDGHLRGGAIQFFQKRARRILPPYYCALILSVALIGTLIGRPTGTHWDICLPVTPVGILGALAMLQEVIGPGQINYVFWSIAVEWKIYFLFPLLLTAWRHLTPVWSTLAVTSLAAAMLLALRGTPLAGLAPQYLALFVFGMLAATVVYSPEERWQSMRRRCPWKLVTALSGFLLLFLTMKWRQQSDDLHVFALDLLVGLNALLLLVTISLFPKAFLRRVLDWKPLAFIGTFSYSIYLIHAPLLQVFWQFVLRPFHLGEQMTFILLSVLGVPLVTGIAYLFFSVCERPFLNAHKRIRPPTEATGSEPIGTA